MLQNISFSSSDQSSAASKKEVQKFWLVSGERSLGSQSSASSYATAQSPGDAEIQPAEATRGEPVTPYISELHQELGVPIVELQGLDAQGVLRQIPRDADGKLSSIGSIKHNTGECSPCLFLKRNCCSKGILCQYCHLRHDDKGKKGMKSKKSKDPEKSAAHSGSTSGKSNMMSL
mmetsp:Transcript_39028/g.108568  ORF Transcript_39028/g.108568 Transcript_39028/m.108568 type:complete len:175 (-) Transcript_39028:119-643(-)